MGSYTGISQGVIRSPFNRFIWDRGGGGMTMSSPQTIGEGLKIKRKIQSSQRAGALRGRHPGPFAAGISFHMF